MNALLIIIVLAIGFVSFWATVEKRRQNRIEGIDEEVKSFLTIVYTTHDIDDMEMIFTLKAAILNHAMKYMDITDLQKKLDEAINSQLVFISDDMVRSGRMK